MSENNEVPIEILEELAELMNMLELVDEIYGQVQ